MNIRFSGFGGQGIVLAGLILGEAAIIEGTNALQAQSYGSASRDGGCKSDVIISDGEIYELEFEATDILVALSQEAYRKYAQSVKEDGILIIDPDLVKPEGEPANLYKIQATEVAYKKFGKKIVGNLVILGYVTAVGKPVSKQALQDSIAKNVPKGSEKMNLDAFDEGYRLGIEEKTKRASA